MHQYYELCCSCSSSFSFSHSFSLPPLSFFVSFLHICRLVSCIWIWFVHHPLTSSFSAFLCQLFLWLFVRGNNPQTESIHTKRKTKEKTQSALCIIGFSLKIRDIHVLYHLILISPCWPSLRFTLTHSYWEMKLLQVSCLRRTTPYAHITNYRCVYTRYACVKTSILVSLLLLVSSRFLHFRRQADFLILFSALTSSIFSLFGCFLGDNFLLQLFWHKRRKNKQTNIRSAMHTDNTSSLTP